MKVTIQKKEIPLKTPFVYYLDTLVKLPYAEVLITTNDAISGVGEIPCALDINGETVESSVALAPFIEHILSDVIIRSEADIVLVMERLSLYIAFNTATRFGVEQALFDILAQKKDMSIAQLFSPLKEKVKMQVVVPYMESEKEYRKKFDEIFQKDPSHIKIKVGADMRRDINAVRIARDYNKDVILSVDANQAFGNLVDALLFLREVEKYSLSWIEQPFSRGVSIEYWKKLKKEISIPLMADESIHTYNDAHFFIQNGVIDYINLKLAKCGGVLEAHRIIELAQKHGIPVMLGSMLEGPIALKYNLAFALSQDFFVHDFSTNYSVHAEHRPLFIDSGTLLSTDAVLL